jgi:hypothetical protein
MAYQDYLQAQSAECIRLAVEQPWSDETGDLLDLALDYGSMASTVALQEPRASPAGDEAGAVPETGAFFGWLTRH